MTNLQFDFLIDKEKNTITVRREFRANRQLVWDCYTKSELLDQWFAPRPFTNTTKSMDFRAGGRWHYFMTDPSSGAKHYCCMDYIKVEAIDCYNALDGFCDENGDLIPGMPRSTWDATFLEMGENALVETVLLYNTLADLEAVVAMGFKEGLSMGLEQLDELLLTL